MECFQTGPNLKNILCKNKDKLIPNSYSGVSELKCSCGSVYNGETKKKIISRSIEHQQESTKGNWSSSGTTEHTKECHVQFTQLHQNSAHKQQALCQESERIIGKRYGGSLYRQDKVLNRENGNFINANAWKPMFKKMKTLH